jgi:phospholipase C
MTSRRNFLRGSASAGIAAATLAAFPPAIRRALAIPANNETGTINDVKHVVILMQENRAFDHYFGTLGGVRGFGDRFTIPLPKGLNVWQQSDASGKPILPFHLDGTKGNAQRANGTPHDWPDSQNAWDGGRMYQWPRYKNPISMGYFKDAEIPFQFALANPFTSPAPTALCRPARLSSATNGTGSTASRRPPTGATRGRRMPSVWKKPA